MPVIHALRLSHVFSLVGVLACALTLSAATALAQDYPNRAVRLVVPYPPGGSADFIVRSLMGEVARELGQPLVIDNRPGGGTNIASELVAQSAPDGYTLLLGNSSSHGINRALFRRLNFDPDRDFIPITRLGIQPMVVAVNPQTGFRTLRDLIARAKAQPGSLNFASSGNGSPNHLAGVQFNALTGGELVHIPYKGGAPSAVATIGGETQVVFGTPPTVLPHIQAGRLVALSTTTPKSSAALPGIPGATQAGLPGYDVVSWHGLFAPRNTPAAIVTRLYQAFARALRSPEVMRRLASGGVDGEPSASPDAFAAQIRKEAPQWEALVKRSAATVD